MMNGSRNVCWQLACVGLALLWGCVGGESDYTQLKPSENVENPDAHHHHVHGPHGGHIVELGDVHGELVFGKDRILTLYLLGEDTKTAAPLADVVAKMHLHAGQEEIDVELTAAPQEGDPEGTSSRFVAAAGVVPDSVKDIEGIEGEVILTIGEKKVVAEVGHGHHDHDHGHKH